MIRTALIARQRRLRTPGCGTTAEAEKLCMSIAVLTAATMFTLQSSFAFRSPRAGQNLHHSIASDEDALFAV
jgi:hypothetical protein